MSCITVFLASAMWGLTPGTCALHCPLDRALVTPINHLVGYVETEREGKVTVYRLDGEWRWVVEQEFEQCEKGGVQW